MVSKREKRGRFLTHSSKRLLVFPFLLALVKFEERGDWRKKRLELRSIKKRSRAGGGGVVIAARKLI